MAITKVMSAKERAEAKARARLIGLERNMRLKEEDDCLEMEKVVKVEEKKETKQKESIIVEEDS